MTSPGRLSPVLTRFMWATAAPALLVAVLDPPPSRGLELPGRLAFWIAHIGIGLLCAVQAAGALNRVRALTLWTPVLRLLLSGLTGAALFAPAALLLEAVIPSTVGAGDGDPDWLDRWEAAGGLAALAAEYLQLLPSYLSAWLVLNLPTLRGDGVRTSDTVWPAMARVTPPAPAETVSPPAASDQRVEDDALPDSGAESFMGRLPPALGRDLIALSADLHYLHVTTTRGRILLLGSLGDAESALGDTGLRVHRSHWVAVRHVRRVARRANGWYCELSDGTRVPISRRRMGAVRACLGVDFVRVDIAQELQEP